jgi:hypothetical protein
VHILAAVGQHEREMILMHRLRHWRWGGKAHWADRVRSNRWQGFLCEGASLPRAD